MEIKKLVSSKAGIAAMGLIMLGGLAAGCSSSTTTDNTTTPATQTTTTQTTPSNDNSMMAMSNDTKSAGLRVALGDLLSEHVDLALAATRSGYDGRADFAALAKSLDNNSVALATTVGSVYGADAQKKFLDIWRSHIGFFVDYTVATKKKDKAGQDAAVQNLGGYEQSFAQFFSDANPNLPKDTLLAAVTEHVAQLKSSVDAYAAGDYTKAYQLENEARAHMSMTAKTLSAGIIAQYPDKFK
jgi:hypothetical protein